MQLISATITPFGAFIVTIVQMCRSTPMPLNAPVTTSPKVLKSMEMIAPIPGILNFLEQNQIAPILMILSVCQDITLTEIKYVMENRIVCILEKMRLVITAPITTVQLIFIVTFQILILQETNYVMELFIA